MRDNVFALCEDCYNPINTTYDKCYDESSDASKKIKGIIEKNEDVQAQVKTAMDTVCTEDDCPDELVLNELCKRHREEVNPTRSSYNFYIILTFLLILIIGIIIFVS